MFTWGKPDVYASVGRWLTGRETKTMKLQEFPRIPRFSKSWLPTSWLLLHDLPRRHIVSNKSSLLTKATEPLQNAWEYPIQKARTLRVNRLMVWIALISAITVFYFLWNFYGMNMHMLATNTKFGGWRNSHICIRMYWMQMDAEKYICLLHSQVSIHTLADHEQIISKSCLLHVFYRIINL